MRKTLYLLLLAAMAAASAYAQPTTTTVDNLVVGTAPTNLPSTQQPPTTGKGVFQNNLLVGSNTWPAAYGASNSDAFLMGNTWFYNQLILTGGNTNIPAWSVNNRTDGNGNVGLVFQPGWALSKSTVFQST